MRFLLQSLVGFFGDGHTHTLFYIKREAPLEWVVGDRVICPRLNSFAKSHAQVKVERERTMELKKREQQNERTRKQKLSIRLPFIYTN